MHLKGKIYLPGFFSSVFSSGDAIKRCCSLSRVLAAVFRSLYVDKRKASDAFANANPYATLVVVMQRWVS